MRAKPWPVAILVGLLLVFVISMGWRFLTRPQPPDLPATHASPTPVEE